MREDTLATLPSREVTAANFEAWSNAHDEDADFERYMQFSDIIEWYIEGKLVAPVPVKKKYKYVRRTDA